MNRIVCSAALGFLALISATRIWAQEDTSVPEMAGSWVATVHRSKAEGNLTQQWKLSQDTVNVTGTIKSDKSSEMPISGKVNGLIFRGVITDGDMHYVVNVSVSSKGDAMDGTIRMGAHEYIFTAQRP